MIDIFAIYPYRSYEYQPSRHILSNRDSRHIYVCSIIVSFKLVLMHLLHNDGFNSLSSVDSVLYSICLRKLMNHWATEMFFFFKVLQCFRILIWFRGFVYLHVIGLVKYIAHIATSCIQKNENSYNEKVCFTMRSSEFYNHQQHIPDVFIRGKLYFHLCPGRKERAPLNNTTVFCYCAVTSDLLAKWGKLDL